jgi:hypothetical protein
MSWSLKEKIDHDYKLVIDFFEAQPGVYDLINEMLDSVQILLSITCENIVETDKNAFQRYMLWITLHEYIEESLLLLIKTRLDESFALLRMSAELSRDIARISESKTNYDLWSEKRTRNDKYKKVFRFNNNDKLETFIYSLYKLSSNYGVHGHQTRDIHLSHLGEVINERFIRVNVPEKQLYKALNIWLRAFFPLHRMVIRTYEASFKQLTPDPLEWFNEFEMTVTPILSDVEKRINTLLG